MNQNTDERAFANVSVEWLMKNVLGSIDGVNMDSPEYLLQYKLSWYIDEKYGENGLSPYYGNLCDKILREGFTVPICVYMEQEWNPDTSAYEWTFAQGNGHHRLALSILLGLDYIPVCFSFTGEYMHCDVTGE